MSDPNTQSAVAFVRHEMLAAEDPPVGQAGLLSWLRENLFSGAFNTILTALSLAAIVSLIWAVYPWFANSVWYADSLNHCREILDGTTGACFAVIPVWWKQLLYGFYPSEIYWRANLTLLLFFTALIPVLFIGVPRRTCTITAILMFELSGAMIWIPYWNVIGPIGSLLFLVVFAVIALAIYNLEKTRRWMLVFSALYPFLMIWLVWGGSIWPPVAALLGFVFAGVCVRFFSTALGSIGASILAVLLAVVWWLVIAGYFSDALASVIPIEIQSVTSRKLGGFMVSLIIGVTSIAISLPLGILLALGRQSNLLIVHTLSVIFIEFIRGVPLITLLFAASTTLNYLLPPGTNFDILLRVIILATLFAAAYNAETIRGGLAGLPRGQYEAADALGLDYWKSQRLIVMPQALKISIPGIVNNFIGLFKDTTLVAFIGIIDIMKYTESIRSNAPWQGIYWELYIFVGLVFFIWCYPMGRYSKWLEGKLATDRH